MSDSESTTTTTTTSSTRKPIIVEYCKVCGFPREYCQNSPNPAACLKANGPYVRPGEQAPSTDTTDSTTTTTTTTSTTATISNITATDLENKLQETKIDDSKDDDHTGASSIIKKKSEKKNSIVIEVIQRNKRKHVTKIIGLEGYGIKLSDATKVMAKKFSCGCSVVKSPTGEEIDIQGDFQDDAIDLILEKWPVVQSNEIYIMVDKKKMRARQ